MNTNTQKVAPRDHEKHTLNYKEKPSTINYKLEKSSIQTQYPQKIVQAAKDKKPKQKILIEETESCIDLTQIPLNKRDINLHFFFPKNKIEYPNEIQSSIPGTFYLVKITEFLNFLVTITPIALTIYFAYNAFYLVFFNATINIPLVSFNLILSGLLFLIGILTTRKYWTQTRYNPPIEILSKESDKNLHHFVNKIAEHCYSPKPLQIGINLSNTVSIQSLQNKKNKIFRDTHHDYMLVIGLPLFKQLNSTELAALIAYKISFFANASSNTLNIIEKSKKTKIYLSYPDSLDAYISKKSQAMDFFKAITWPIRFFERSITACFYAIMKNTIQRITYPLNQYALQNAIYICGFENTKNAFYKSKGGEYTLQKIISKVQPLEISEIKNPIEATINFDLNNKKLNKKLNKRWDQKIKALKKQDLFDMYEKENSKFKKVFPAYVLMNSYFRTGQQIIESHLNDQNISPMKCKQLSQQWYDSKKNWTKKDPTFKYFNAQFRKNRAVIPKLYEDEFGSITTQKTSLKSKIIQIRDDFPNYSLKTQLWDNYNTPHLDKVIDNEVKEEIVDLEEDINQSEQPFSERIGTALNIISAFNSFNNKKEFSQLIEICNLYSRSLYKLDQLYSHSSILKKSLEEHKNLHKTNKKITNVIRLQNEIIEISKKFPENQITACLFLETLDLTQTVDNEKLLEKSINLIWAYESCYIGAIIKIVSYCEHIEKRLKLDPIN